MDKNFEGTEEEYIEFRKRRNKANRRYYSKPEVRESKKIYAKEYRLENKEKISEYGKRVRALPKTQERMKKWTKENKEHIREYANRPENKEKKRISDKKWREKKTQNKNWVKEKYRKNAEFRKNNPEKVKNSKRKYYQSPKGKVNSTYHNHRRLSLVKESETDLTNEYIEEMLRKNTKCIYCGSDKKLEIDHIIPLSKGGSCLKVNLVIACAKCNRSKSDRDVLYWCKLMGREVPKIVIERLEKMNS